MYLNSIENKIENNENFSINNDISEFGIILNLQDGIAKIIGLNNIQMGELLIFENNSYGMVLNLKLESSDVVLFGNDTTLNIGSLVKRTNNVLSIEVGEYLLGHIVDPFVEFLDGSIKTENKKENLVLKLKNPDGFKIIRYKSTKYYA